MRLFEVKYSLIFSCIKDNMSRAYLGFKVVGYITLGRKDIFAFSA